MSTTTINPTAQAQQLVNKAPSLKDGACLMAVQVTGSCGEATLSGSAAMLDGETLESNLVKGTTLQWFPKDKLRFVNKSLQRINRLLSSQGVAFGRGLTMIPLSISDEVQSRIDHVKREFDEEVENLVEVFDEVIEAHKAENADISHLIDRFKMDVDQFKGRFHFKAIPPMAVQPLFEDDEDALRENITQTLWEEIATEASKLAKATFIGKEQCSQKAVSAVRKIKTKLVNLAFLDEGIFKVVESFEQALEDLPLTGPITNGEFHRLANYIQTISSEENLRAISAGEFEETLLAEDEEDTALLDDEEMTQSETDIDTSADAVEDDAIESEKVINDVEPNDDDNADVSTTPVTSESNPAPELAFEENMVFDEELDFGGF